MLRVTVSQYHGVFASVIALRPGPNLKSGKPHIGQDAQDLHAFEGREEIAVPEHRRIECPVIDGGARHLVEPQEPVSFRLARPQKITFGEMRSGGGPTS